MKSGKIIKQPQADRRRWYDDACGAAHALDLVGERWALLVMRELMFGPKRFSALRADLPGISANVLTQRLEGLEATGVVARRLLPPPASAQVYELTAWGQESEPIFQALGRWAARSPLHDPTLLFSAASLMLSLRTMIDPARVAGMEGRVGFRLGQENFTVTVSGAGIDIARGMAGAEAVLEGAPPVIAALIYSGQSLETLETAGALKVEGNRDLVQRFIPLFPLPTKISPLTSALTDGSGANTVQR